MNKESVLKNMKREPKVYCSKCEQWYGDSNIEFLNIEEDEMGRDKLTFKCPEKHETKSIVVTR